MADVLINIKIPDMFVTSSFEAVSALTDVPINISCRSAFSGERGSFSVTIPHQTGGETNKQFAERWISEWVKAAIKMYFLSKDITRFNSDINTITPPSDGVEDGSVVPQ